MDDLSRPLEIAFGIVTLAVGMMIMWKPRLLSYIVGILLIILGVMAIFNLGG